MEDPTDIVKEFRGPVGPAKSDCVRTGACPSPLTNIRSLDYDSRTFGGVPSDHAGIADIVRKAIHHAATKDGDTKLWLVEGHHIDYGTSLPYHLDEDFFRVHLATIPHKTSDADIEQVIPIAIERVHADLAVRAKRVADEARKMQDPKYRAEKLRQEIWFENNQIQTMRQSLNDGPADYKRNVYANIDGHRQRRDELQAELNKVEAEF